MLLDVFDVPIGTATKKKNSKGAVPLRAENWFPNKDVARERSAAKCIIYLLRNDKTNSTILPYVTQMINLLEQFFHPSNGGDWTASLTLFLKHLVQHLMKVISSQVHPILAESAFKFALQDSGQETRENLTIPKVVQSVLVEHLLKMASRGQFSKNKDMRSEAAQAFRQLAYLEPQLVLPLVYNRSKCAPLQFV